MTPGRLYCTKMLWGALVLATLLAVRSAAFACPWERQSISLEIFHGGSSLSSPSFLGSQHDGLPLCSRGCPCAFVNQAVSLVCGIFGSFIGIMSIAFPGLAGADCPPGGYYGLLSLARMEWDPDTRFTQYFWRWPEPLDVALLLLWAALFFIVGRTLFVRKEV